MEKRYGALRTIGTIYKVLGIIVGVLAIIAVLAVCATGVIGGAGVSNFGRGLDNFGISSLFGSILGALFGSFLLIIYLGGLAITLYAIGEGIYLFLALEENTRATVALLQRQVPPTQPPAA